MLLLLLPVLAPATILVALLSGCPPLVALSRAGHRGKCIWLIKLRTMWGSGERSAAQYGWIERIESSPVPAVKTPRDPRITSRFAAFCRRHSVDELPQLWHVVTGEMALVGPRPLTYDEMDCYYREFSAEILSVRPGLTGLWQVKGRNSLTYSERLELDLVLVRKRSVRLYLQILAATVPALISGRNAG
jgi:lipopolysaccharide/colanic/teichoic acid biosynthesis glycosyltransferase